MKLVRVAAAAVNQTPLAWDENAAHLREALDEARRQGASLVCLPELCITGYGCEDAFLSPDTARTALEVLQELLPATRGLVTCFGLPVWLGKAVYNAVCLVADGRLQGFVAKQALAGDGLHYEPRWFKPWPRGQRTQLSVAGQRYPFGDLRFDCGSIRVGFEICEDAWVVGRPRPPPARHHGGRNRKPPPTRPETHPQLLKNHPQHPPPHRHPPPHPPQTPPPN